MVPRAAFCASAGGLRETACTSTRDASSLLHRAEPMKPCAPVTRAFVMPHSNLEFRYQSRGRCCLWRLGSSVAYRRRGCPTGWLLHIHGSKGAIYLEAIALI